MAEAPRTEVVAIHPRADSSAAAKYSPAAPVITLLTCVTAIAYSNHVADPRILNHRGAAAKFAPAS